MKTSNDMMVEQIGMQYSRSEKKKVSQCLVKSHQTLFVHQRYTSNQPGNYLTNQNRTRPSHHTDVAMSRNFRTAHLPSQTKG